MDTASAAELATEAATTSTIIFVLGILVVPVVILLNIILFFKIWYMCNDVRTVRDRLIDPLDDLRFWERARYESEKRRGIITEADIAIAEAFIAGGETPTANNTRHAVAHPTTPPTEREHL